MAETTAWFVPVENDATAHRTKLQIPVHCGGTATPGGGACYHELHLGLS